MASINIFFDRGINESTWTNSSYIVFPLLLGLYPETILGPGETYNFYTVGVALAVGFVGVWKHRINISNLINKVT